MKKELFAGALLLVLIGLCAWLRMPAIAAARSGSCTPT